jgi:2-phosphosulfolactate phosphatase
MNVEVILSPAEFGPLAQRDLSGTTCVVFDVLRATSSMITALNNGTEAIIPVSEIPEALDIHRGSPQSMLAGERHGVRINRELTGNVDFDFGNSPREFTPDKVASKSIIWTTTNGTRALRACLGAEMTLIAALLNLRAVTETLDTLRPKQLVIVCAGTFEEVAYEDTFAAGALMDRLAHLWQRSNVTDSARIAHATFLQANKSTEAIKTSARNARKLLSVPDLAADVDVCLQTDSIHLNASLLPDGSVRPMRGFAARLA